jgi:hypothetical protein
MINIAKGTQTPTADSATFAFEFALTALSADGVCAVNATSAPTCSLYTCGEIAKVALTPRSGSATFAFDSELTALSADGVCAVNATSAPT